MVAQFRVQDYGMERCRIVSSIPSATVLKELDTPFVLQGNTSSLQVWNLTTPAAPNSELDVRKLSRSTRPTRGQLLAHFDVQEDSSYSSDDFWCGPSGSLQTLEIHCHGSGCHIEFFQSFYFKPRFGMLVRSICCWSSKLTFLPLKEYLCLKNPLFNELSRDK